METKIVYVVYGSRTEISNLIAFMVSGEYSFHYSGEYLYFCYDPTELIKEAGMELKAVVEHWATNCFNFKDAPQEEKAIRVERCEETVKADTTIKVNSLSTATNYMKAFKEQNAIEVRDPETRNKGGRKYNLKGEIIYLYQA